MSPRSILSGASRDLLSPLPPPGWPREGIREILCFVGDLPVAKLHDTHRVCQTPRVRDCVLRDPRISVSEGSLVRLRIITNGILIVNIVFHPCITD